MAAPSFGAFGGYQGYKTILFKAQALQKAGRTLSPVQKRVLGIHQAAVNTRMNNPQAFGPNTNLTPRQLNQQVAADTQLKFGPAQSLLNTSLGQVDPAFDLYKQSLQNAASGAAQGVQQAQTAINTAAGNLNAQDLQQRNALLAQLQADAQARGGSIDPAIAAQLQQASSARQAQANSDAALAGQLGQNEQNFLNSLQTVANLGAENRKQTIQQKLSDLAAQRGQFATQDRAAIIDAARKYGIELGTLSNATYNAQTARGTAQTNAAVKVGGLNERVRHDTATEQLQATNPSRQKVSAELTYFNQHGYWPPTGPPKGSKNAAGSFTPTQLRKSSTTYRSLLSWARGQNPNPSEYKTLVHAIMLPKKGSPAKTEVVHDPTTGKVKYDPKTGLPLRKVVQQSQGAGQGISDPLLARVVAQVAIFGGVTNATTQRQFLANYGIKVPILRAPDAKFPGTGRNKGERPT